MKLKNIFGFGRFCPKPKGFDFDFKMVAAKNTLTIWMIHIGGAHLWI